MRNSRSRRFSQGKPGQAPPRTVAEQFTLPLAVRASRYRQSEFPWRAERFAKASPPRMDFKFSCPACAQHISAAQEMSGSNAACPACGAAFIVPPCPPPPPSAPLPPKVQKLAAQIRATGFQFEIPAGIESGELEEALQKFHALIRGEPARLAKKIRDLGYEFTLPPDIEREDLENALDSFLSDAEDAFDESLLYMEADEVITRRPTGEQIREIGNRLLALILKEGGTDESDFRLIVLQVAPEIRA